MSKHTPRSVTQPAQPSPKQRGEQMTNSELLDVLNEINNWLVCGCIATPEDMAQSFPYMQNLVETAITKLTAEQP